MTDKDKLVDHLVDRVSRVFVVTEDGLESLTAQFRIEGLPEAVKANTSLDADIHRIASALLASKYGPKKRKPDASRKKIERLAQMLREPEIVDQLNLALSRPKASKLLKQLKSALNYRVEPSIGTGQPRQISVNYRRPELTAIELAEAVAEALRAHGLIANTSKTGLLVQTLEAIKSTTGFKTNSQESARIACGGAR